MYVSVSWKKGAHVKMSPDAAFDIFEQIRIENDGDLQPQAIVNKAQATEGHPLHDEFEWNVDIAAKLQWNNRASELRRSLCVVRKGAEELGPTRLYEIVDKPLESGRVQRICTTLEEILADPIERAILLERAKNDLKVIKKRYTGLTELRNVFDAIDQAA